MEDDKSANALGKQLQRAVRSNDKGAALEALDAGADPNWMNPSTATAALHIACKMGHTKLALLLVQRGADVNAQTKTGWIPMHFAVNSGLVELVELLHASGGRADIVNEWMKTPMDVAKERKNEEMVEILKKRPGVGATPRSVRDTGAAAGGALEKSAGSISALPTAPVPTVATVVATPLPAETLVVTQARTLDHPGKSPRVVSEGKSPRVMRPGKEAPAPPAKEAPAPPTKKRTDETGGSAVESSPLMGKSRSQFRGSGTEWVDGKAGGDGGRGPYVVKLEQDVAALRNELEAVKRELARVVALVERK